MALDLNGQLIYDSGRVLLGTVEVGELKDVTLDFSSTSKEYKGKSQYKRFKIVTARQITGKATSGVIDAELVAKYLDETVATPVDPATTFPLTIGGTEYAPTKKIAITNAEIAKATTYAVELIGKDVDGKVMIAKFPACTFEKYSFGMKTEDFGDGSLEFEVIESAANGVGELYFE